MSQTKQELNLYNTLNRKKEKFVPLQHPHVGMYVCGPTVYGDAHLGHARPAITFDLIFRYLKHLGYKVRYVRNITDVGHLEDEGIGEGEDKISKKARLKKLEPMEVVQHYSNSYHKNMEQLNVQNPSIEPRASGHIIEQIEIIKKILTAGFAYEIDGNVYFNLKKYNKLHKYGKLSGRNIEDMLSTTRELTGQQEKKNSYDFALWKKASPTHIMRWPSPWGDGFPGWHTECTAMSCKYLGEHFDIHGGGMDLLFPHHESEIAQSVVANKKEPAKYWVHNNMITIDGQKMGKSLENFITLNEFFSGNHKAVEQTYSPMTIRFFILQAHYRSTLDFSNDALQAAEKGLQRMMCIFDILENLPSSKSSSFSVSEFEKKIYAALNDDFNSPIAISILFDGIRLINCVNIGSESLTKNDVEKLKQIYHVFIIEILGLRKNKQTKDNFLILDSLMKTILEIRKEAKLKKDWKTADKIRDDLKKLNIIVKDTKEGTAWSC